MKRLIVTDSTSDLSGNMLRGLDQPFQGCTYFNFFLLAIIFAVET